MKIKTLNNKKIKIYLFGLLMGVILLFTLLFTASFAKYRNTESINIVKGIINYKPYDLGLISIKQEDENGEYQNVDVIPTSGYKLNNELSYCEVNGVKDDTVEIEYEDGKVNVTMSIKGTKCYLYFDEIEGLTINEIISTKNISTRTDFTTVYTADTTGTVFTAEDDDGMSYYYAGAATDNYVKFAGFYWRIIRVNGDGTIRLIYDGTSARLNGIASEATQIGTSVFNNSYNDNMYVGFMYASGQVHGLETSSTIKGVLDTWYSNNLESHASYIDTNSGFCGDRSPSTSYSFSNGGGGTGTTETYYGAHIRSVVTKSPSFKCPDMTKDLYTKFGASKGNRALTNPIGLITTDEVVYAGGFLNKENKSYYLYTGNMYFLLSPSNFSSFSTSITMFYVASDGHLDNGGSGAYARGVRPVINLRADTIFKEGTTGTADNPYVLAE